MPTVGVKLKLDNQTYTYTTLQSIDGAIANTQMVIEQRERRLARDREVLRRLSEGRVTLAEQVADAGRRAAARKREKNC